MKISINNETIHIATGGKPFDAALPTVVFIHGSGLDHRTWALQARWFAFHGYSVLAPDFPAHSLSGGSPLTRIEDMATWLISLLNTVGAHNVHLVGHSQGGLVGLECASAIGERIQSLNIIASAAAIPVNPALIETAAKNPAAAATSMLQWGFGRDYRFGLSEVPGQAPIAIGKRIMTANPLYEDLVACNEYQRGEEVAKSLNVPTQLVLAHDDRMTPFQSGKALADALNNASVTDLPAVGHMLPIEAPRPCLKALRLFIRKHDTQLSPL